MIPVHRWSVQAVLAPGHNECVFMHSSRFTGTQVLDSTPLIIPDLMRTEREILGELYGGLLTFMERRA